MASKSDKRRARAGRVSATEASRTFSDILDRVEGGTRFVIHRRGRDVCIMAPPTVLGRRASECLALLSSRPAVTLDDRFGADLRRVLAAEPLEDRPAWDS